MTFFLYQIGVHNAICCYAKEYYFVFRRRTTISYLFDNTFYTQYLPLKEELTYNATCSMLCI